MRSEGYPTASGRDNGVASVLKNRDNKDRYAEIEEDGIHYVILKAGNGQEIARSCPSKEKIGLLGFLPLLGLGALGLGGMAAAAGAIPEVVAVPPVVEVPKVAPLAYAEPEVAAAAGGLPKWLLPLIGLILFGLLLWWLLKGCKSETPSAIITTPVMVDSLKEDTAAATVAPPVVGEQVEGFAPVTLYFENDQPGKNSQAETTGLDYMETYNKYIKLKGKFNAEQDTPEAKTAIDAFFDSNVTKGSEDLKALTTKIGEAVQAGKRVEVTVKAFASPLAETGYNEKLTKRRIASIDNYFNGYEGGLLKKYQDKINITQQANGESSSASGLSDDAKNTKLSIYDLGPSKERRVEIVDVRFIKQ